MSRSACNLQSIPLLGHSVQGHFVIFHFATLSSIFNGSILCSSFGFVAPGILQNSHSVCLTATFLIFLSIFPVGIKIFPETLLFSGGSRPGAEFRPHLIVKLMICSWRFELSISNSTLFPWNLLSSLRVVLQFSAGSLSFR